MKKLGPNLALTIASMSGNDEQARINLRAHQVRQRYKSALEKVYKSQAELFLAHTNNVYIMNKSNVRTLIVYVDESIFAAELNAQRELIKLKLLELFGEQIEEFEIYVSRGAYKKNHPYLVEETQPEGRERVRVALSEEEISHIDELVSSVEDERVRRALKKAMKADLEFNKSDYDQ